MRIDLNRLPNPMAKRAHHRSRRQLLPPESEDAFAAKNAREQRKRRRQRWKRIQENALLPGLMLAVVVGTGLPVWTARLPYVYTGAIYHAWLLLSLAIMSAFVLVARYRPDGKVALWKRWYGSSSAGTLLRFTIVGGLIAVLMAWCTICMAIWLTYLYAPVGYVATHVVTGVERSSRKAHLYLDDDSRVQLSRQRYEAGFWQAGERLCFIGRTWWLGTVVDQIDRDITRCISAGGRTLPASASPRGDALAR